MQYFKEWRTADHVAFAAEKAVLAATLRMIDGGPAPSAIEIADSHRLRAIADALFSVAIQEMSEIGKKLTR